MLFQSRVCPQTGKVQSCDTRSGALVFEQPFIAFIVVFAHPSKCTQFHIACIQFASNVFHSAHPASWLYTR